MCLEKSAATIGFPISLILRLVRLILTPKEPVAKPLCCLQ